MHSQNGQLVSGGWLVALCMCVGCGESAPQTKASSSTHSPLAEAPAAPSTPKPRLQPEGAPASPEIISSSQVPAAREIAEAKAIASQIMVSARFQVEWDDLALPLGEPDPDCLSTAKQEIANLKELIVNTYGEIAVEFQNTGLVLQMVMASEGRADGVRIRENGVLCRSLKARFYTDGASDFFASTPTTCNEFLAAVRAASCLQQVNDELTPPIDFVRFATRKPSLNVVKIGSYATCPDARPDCRGALMFVDLRFVVETDHQADRLESKIIAKGGQLQKRSNAKRSTL